MASFRIMWGALALAFMFFDLWGYYEASGWFKHWMSTYGHDAFLPAFLYFFNRAIWQARINRRKYVALYVFAGATAFELAQLFGYYAGTFDPYDLAAYLIGVSLASGIDFIIVHQMKKAPALRESAQNRKTVSGTRNE